MPATRTRPLGRPPKAENGPSNALRYTFERDARKIDQEIAELRRQRDRLRDAAKALR